MKKIIALFILFIVFPCMTVYADNEKDKLLDDLGTALDQRLKEDTDSEVSDIIDEYGLSVEDHEKVSELSFGTVIGKLLNVFTDNLRRPLKMLGKLLAAVLLCSLAGSLSSEGSELNSVYGMIGTLAAIISVYDALNDSIVLIVNTMEGINGFMLSYIPIYAGITVSMGNYVSGSSYYASDLFLCECIALLTKTVLVPFLSVLTAVSVTGALNPDIKLGNAALSVKKVINWSLGIMMTVFTGLMTIQSKLGSAAGDLKTRTVRFAASSLIPVIGGAVSESYSAIKSSLGVIRSGAGALGIIIIAVLVIRPLLTVLALRAAIAAAVFFSDMLSQDNISQLLRSIGSILSIGMSIMISFSMMFIISTSILMTAVSGNGA